MTVVLLINSTRSVPIAPESVFTQYWQRGCSELGLRWVPWFQPGIEISQQDLPAVLEELSRLQVWAKSPDSAIPGYVLQRIENLISELEQLRGSTAKIWIG